MRWNLVDGILIAFVLGEPTIAQLVTKDRNHDNDVEDDVDTYRPLFVMTISVPSLWNFSQSSLPSSVTLGSSTTPSSSGWWGGTRGWCGAVRGWCVAKGCGDAWSMPGGSGGLRGLIVGPPGPWWWWCNAAAAAARTSSGVCGPRPRPEILANVVRFSLKQKKIIISVPACFFITDSLYNRLLLRDSKKVGPKTKKGKLMKTSSSYFSVEFI